MKLITYEMAEQLAQKFRVEHDLSSKEAINLKSLLRKLNILTVFRPLSEKFYGMSLRSASGSRSILVNSANPKGRQHYTIAHELYHLYIESEMTPHSCQEQIEGVKDVNEKNADRFASALLMPKDGLLEFISNEEIKGRKVNLSTVIRVEQYFSVSRQALLFRLKQIGLIPQAELEQLLEYSVINSAKQYGYDTALYRAGNDGLVIGDFGMKARVLFEKEVISEGHYIELLNLVSDGKN